MKQTFGTQPIFLEGLWKTQLYLLLPKVSPSLREDTLRLCDWGLCAEGIRASGEEWTP